MNRRLRLTRSLTQKNVSANKGKKWVVQKNKGALSCWLGACELDGMNDMTDCQREMGGYRWRILAEKLEAKLKSAKVSSPDFNDAFRYQDRLTKSEQQAANQDYVKLYNARLKFCNDNFSRMTDHN